MTKSAFGWLVMTLLALSIAAYAGMTLFVPESRNPFASAIVAAKPFAAIAHFACGGTALIAGAFQFNSWLRNRFRAAHRWIGRVYVFSVAIGGTAGLWMAVSSFGGMTGHIGFGLLAVFWMSCSLNAYRHIRQRNVAAHQGWMIRSYALTLAAVTLRVYIPASERMGISIEVAYPMIAWLCWVPNLFVAEWYIRSRWVPRLAQSSLPI